MSEKTTKTQPAGENPADNRIHVLEKTLSRTRAVHKAACEKIFEYTIRREQAEDEEAKLTKEIGDLRGELRMTLAGYNSTDKHAETLQGSIDARQKKLDWATTRIQTTKELIEEQENKKAETAATIVGLEQELYLNDFSKEGENYNKYAEGLAQAQAKLDALNDRYVRAGGDPKLLQKSLSLQGHEGFVGSWRCIPQFRLPQDRQNSDFLVKGRPKSTYWPEDVRPFYCDHTRYGADTLRAHGKYDSKTYIPKD